MKSAPVYSEARTTQKKKYLRSTASTSFYLAQLALLLESYQALLFLLLQLLERLLSTLLRF